MKPFTTPKLSTKNPKDWFVYWRENGKLKTDRSGINRIKDLKERRIRGEEMCRSIYAILQGSGKKPEIETIHSVTDAIRHIIAIKEKTARDKTKSGYKWALSRFTDWGKADHIRPGEFTSIHAQAFMDHLLTNRDYSLKSYNNMLIMMRTFFNGMVDRGIIDKNPFKLVTKKNPISHNTSYTRDEMDKLDKWLYAHYFRLWLFKEFIYCAAIRRAELVQLKVQDIGKDTIIVPAGVSKNKKQEPVSINKRLKIVIEMMELSKYHPGDYVFGKSMETCPEPYKSPNRISDLHFKAIKACKIREECGLYSWKHTGAINLYLLTRDIYLVKRHLRHSSIDITEIYLKSLGIVLDQSINDLSW